MPPRLKPSAFDNARPLPDRIQTRGWIWQGRQALDGLCCVKGWFEGQGWIAALTPWLDHAAELRETDGLVVLSFEKPLECECASLGRILPLRRTHGALASFPFVLSGAPDTGLADQLLIIDQGDRLMTPLGAFTAVDVAWWWRFDGLMAEEGAPLPELPSPPTPESLSSNSTPFDPDGFGAGLDDVRDRIERASRSPARIAGNLSRHVLGGVARILAWILIASFVIWALVALASIDDHSPNFIRMIAYAVSAVVVYRLYGGVFTKLFGPPTKLIGPAAGDAQGKGAPAAASPIAIPDHQFGFMRRAAGWLFWNSSLASGARDKYSRRLRELEALFESGRVDEALRKAVALGAPRKTSEPKQQGWFGDFPLGGPGLRKSLNIRLQLGRAPSFGILTQAGFEGVRELYRKQAEALLERGDFERAAFIYAELLGDPEAAVRVFERKGDFETAAKLAQGRRLPPSLFVPLWFKAGNKSRALRLAVQYDAFADLMTHVTDGDPFRIELVKAWSSRLIETGDFPRALELTEPYAAFAPERREWILQALDQRQEDAVLLARALRCLPEGHSDRLQALLGQFVARKSARGAAERVKLASRMGDANFEKAATDAACFSRRLPVLGLTVLRALLHDEAHHGSDKDRRDAALALSEAAGQLALRVDLRRLNHVAAKAPAQPVKRMVMNETKLTPVRDVIFLGGNRLLTAYATGALLLTTLDGRKLWSDHVYNIRGFASICAGSMVLIVRDEVEGTALSLLNLEDRTHKDIGFIDIQAFHPQASEIGWMVFAGGQVRMLDTSSLIAAARRGGGTLEHHWAVPMTEAGRLCAFRDDRAEVSFLYQRELGGLVELWMLRKPTLQVECSFLSRADHMPTVDVQTYGWCGTCLFCFPTDKCGPILTRTMPCVPYSLATERRLVEEKQGWLLADQSIASPVGLANTPWCSSRSGAKATSVPSTSGGSTQWCAASHYTTEHEPFAIEFPNAGRVSAHAQGNSPVMTVFDDLGRIVVVDLARSKPLFRNDKK